MICRTRHPLLHSLFSLFTNKFEFTRLFCLSVKMPNTTNVQVGKGYVRNVIFQSLLFQNVKNPIIIDQNYGDKEQGNSTELVINSWTYDYNTFRLFF